jgi:putative transcriptional regulator
MKPALFKDLVTSIRQAGRIRRGTLPPSRVFTFHPDDIKAIRIKLKRSQSGFAHMIGVSVATLRNWEQGRRVPHGPARALLKVAAMRPKAVAEALGR